MGEDLVQGYLGDARRMLVTVECDRGQLFIDAPYTVCKYMYVYIYIYIACVCVRICGE